MKKNNLLYFYFFYFLLIYLFIFLTNSYYSFEDSLKFGGADGFSYMSISKEAPLITSEKLMSIHSERFFFPYLIGIFSKFLNFDFYLSYKIFVIVILVIINLFTIKILRFLKLNFFSILIFLTFINLNPYITRFYIAIPTIINDLIFVAGILIVLEKIISKNKNKFLIYIGYILTFPSRQTSIGLVLAYLVSKTIKGKKILSTKFEIYGLLIFIIFLILSIFYSANTIENVSSRLNLYSPKMRLFGFFVQDVSLKDKLIFLLLPFLSFAPLLFYFIFTRKFKYSIKEIIKSKLLVFLVTFVGLVILQPILSGAEITGRNVMRLTTLAYIPFLIFLILITKEKKSYFLNKKYFTIIVLVLTIFHSFHPTFSIIKIFDILRF